MTPEIKIGNVYRAINYLPAHRYNVLGTLVHCAVPQNMMFEIVDQLGDPRWWWAMPPGDEFKTPFLIEELYIVYDCRPIVYYKGDRKFDLRVMI